MRESSPHGLTERRRAILRQASAALHGRLVTLWRVRRWGPAVAGVASAAAPPPDAIEFGVAGVLRRWGRVLCDESLWLGCRLGAHRWHVAPVRDDLPTPPPAAIERRSPERLTLELCGLSLGALERLWTAADQATVYLCAALDVLDGCLWHVREATGLSIVTRAHLLADLAAVASARKCRRRSPGSRCWSWARSIPSSTRCGRSSSARSAAWRPCSPAISRSRTRRRGAGSPGS